MFELSRCERADIRARSVSHLLNIDAALAVQVADGLALEMPSAAVAAMPTMDLPPSPKLSILAGGPVSFRGRKLGVLVTNDSSATLLAAIDEALQAVGAIRAIIAPKIGGVTLDDGSLLTADYKIDGGPSVLFDVVAIIPAATGAELLALDATAKDFGADACAHCKFIGFTANAEILFAEARVPTVLDDGFVALSSPTDVEEFLTMCGKLRFWPRELAVDLDAA